MVHVSGNSRKEDTTSSSFSAEIRLDYIFFRYRQITVVSRKILEFVRKAEQNVFNNNLFL